MLLHLLFSYNIIISPIIHGFSHFFFSMKRKPALKEKSEGGASPLYPLGRTGAELRQRPRGRLSLPPPPPLVSRVSRPVSQLTCIRARLEYEIERCIALFLTSSRFCYRSAFEEKKRTYEKTLPLPEKGFFLRHSRF